MMKNQKRYSASQPKGTQTPGFLKLVSLAGFIYCVKHMEEQRFSINILFEQFLKVFDSHTGTTSVNATHHCTI